MTAVIEEHTRYVRDARRLAAYRRALRAVVSEGDVVLDLGAGTGILGLMACEAGAARVYSVDGSRMAGVARRVARGSELAERVHVLHGHSGEIELPERADVVVADQMAPFGVGAGLVESFADARARLLRPKARCVPALLELWVTLVEAPGVRQDIEAWSSVQAPGDFGVMRELAESDPRWVRPEHMRPLGDAVRYAQLDLQHAQPERLSGTLSWMAARPGRADAVVGFFRAALGGGAEVTNSPLVDERVDRPVLVLPFAEPLSVRPNQPLRLRLHVDPSDMSMGWQIGLEGEPSHMLVRQTSLPSLLLDRGDLARSAADHKPVLTGRGSARLRVLALCDGTRTVVEMARLVREEHPQLLRTEAAARRFVAHVLAGSSQ